jgi:hypothetical protein
LGRRSVGLTKKRRIAVWAMGAAMAAVVATGATVVAITLAAPTTATVVDMRGHKVEVDSAQVPTEAHVQAAKATDETGARFKVSSVGLDVPFGALNAVDGSITPPGFTSAYWVRNLGVSVENAAKGTVFVVMHSVRGGGTGPGNYLIDVDHRKAKVATGATITVGDLTYSVTGTEAIPKDDLADDREVWANTPDRLVIITCLQVPSGSPSVDNMVITATRIP